jgi:hypothetical protein
MAFAGLTTIIHKEKASFPNTSEVYAGLCTNLQGIGELVGTTGIPREKYRGRHSGSCTLSQHKASGEVMLYSGPVRRDPCWIARRQGFCLD